MTNNIAEDAASSSRRNVRRDEKKSGGIKLFLRDLVIILVAAITISFVVKTYLVRSFYIPSSSMENTLQLNDRIIINQLQPKIFPITNGDIVVFTDPGGWLPSSAAPPQSWIEEALTFIGLNASDSSNHLIKRVIGMPGDRVECCTPLGQITVNGVPLDEPYIKLPQGAIKATSKDFSVTVPDDSLWVMGDNRYNSADSVYHKDEPTGGFVKIDSVVGRAMIINWPVDHWTVLDNYPLTFKKAIESAQ